MAESDGGSPAMQVASAISRYGTLLYPADDAILGPSLHHYGEWAQREIDLLLELLPPGATAVDVGAFVGTHTLAFARHAGGVCRVHAFEPDPRHFDLLTRNLDLNDLRNVKAYRVALAAERGPLAFARGEGSNYGHARLVDPADAGGIRVEAVTLDQLRLAFCDVIKIDVEGMEAEVLQGAQATLARCRPIVYCECNALEQGWPVVVLMRQLGFGCWGHSFTAFNPDNFRGDPRDVFDGARELGLLFVPHERALALSRLLHDRARLARIETLDDLALCLLRKPQYKVEVLARTAAAGTLGVEFLGDERAIEEAAALRAQLGRVHAALEEAQSLAWGRAADLERLDARLAETQSAHEYAQQLAYARAAEIAEANEQLAQLRRQLADAEAALRRAPGARARATGIKRQAVDGHD